VRSDWLMSGCYSRKAASFLPYRAAHEQRGDHRLVCHSEERSDEESALS
jgi:hypothetical protein